MDEAIMTQRMRLRRVAAEDLGLVDELNRDAAVVRYIGTAEPTESVLARWLYEKEQWIAHDRSTGEFVGALGMRVTGPGEYELGYRLRTQVWGRGLATEGARALVARAFDVLDARRVWAQTMTVNIASRRVLEKAGLRYVRTFHQHYDEVLDGAQHGDVEYELRRGTTSA